MSLLKIKSNYRFSSLATLALVLGFNSFAIQAKKWTDQELEQFTSTQSIAEIQDAYLKGELSVSRLTQFYLDKIKREDHKYNSVIALNPNVLTVAENQDKALAQYNKQNIPALFGVPILLKDNIESFELPTTAGSLALINNNTKRDATLTANLRKNGALILGKTNLSEWANFRSERSSSGWSAVGGQTKNPHDVSRTPCGSSSGSGAAVAANLAIAAIGTETNGSITCPAAVNGVVGVKPTVGLVSRFGVVPISPSQDTAGPMTKNVADAKRILFAMQGMDTKDIETTQSGLKKVSKVAAPVPLEGLRLGVVYSSAEQHEQVADIMKQAQLLLKQHGVELVIDLKFESYDGFWADSYTQLLREFKTSINHYFSSLPSDIPNELNSLTLEGLIEFNQQNAEREMPFFQQEIFVKSQATEGMNTQRYKNLKSKLKRVTGKENIDALLKKHKLDALIAVTRGPAWKIDKINGDHSNGGVSSFSAISGYPHITIPMAKLHSLPIGISVMTGFADDEKALNIAASLETVLQK
ncbi:amidase [Psychrosphaera ytuae]|uniref:Amidase n=1 Tax=Psychrosphaera ytuae TaxID=2820710 RepID=A0A975DBK6_9GAMM|nr:amidase [Psychrosphaera ytuae]QTH64145.1 amidase [Psychrosphaera ytuae]